MKSVYFISAVVLMTLCSCEILGGDTDADISAGPSFCITSLDIEGVVGIKNTFLSDDSGEFESLCIIDREYHLSRLKFTFETDDSSFSEKFRNSLFLKADSMCWISDKYIMFEGVGYHCNAELSDTDRTVFGKYVGHSILVRATDGAVMSISEDELLMLKRSHSYDRATCDGKGSSPYTMWRESFDGSAIYFLCRGEYPLLKITEKNNVVVVTSPVEIRISHVDAKSLLIDANGNFLLSKIDGYYVIHTDGSIQEFSCDSGMEFFEANYCWYAVGFHGDEIEVYSISAENRYSMELLKTYDFYVNAELWKRGNTVIGLHIESNPSRAVAIELGEEILIDIQTLPELTRFDLMEGATTSDGKFYAVKDGNVEVLDFMTGEVDVYECDRTGIPEMTSEQQDWDSYSYCFYEYGYRLSDGQLMTAVTDCFRRRVFAYDGTYDPGRDYILFPDFN